MSIFSGPEIIIKNHSSEQLFNKLSNLNNLESILPEEIEDFHSNENQCSFKMKGMPKLTLSISKKIPFSQITLVAENSPIDFSLNCFISNIEEECQVRIEVNAELNMMMRMMAEKPITNFINILSKRLESI